MIGLSAALIGWRLSKWVYAVDSSMPKKDVAIHVLLIKPFHAVSSRVFAIFTLFDYSDIPRSRQLNSPVAEKIVH